MGAGAVVATAARRRINRGGQVRNYDASKQIIRLSLLPFVDIVFGTIGIFTVVFAVQNVLEAKEGIQPGVDRIVTCVEGNRLTAHWPDGGSIPSARPERSHELLGAMGNTESPFRSMILALSGECEKARRLFLKAFERYLDVSANPADDDHGAPPYVMLELYPIGDAADAAALLKRWRSEGGDE